MARFVLLCAALIISGGPIFAQTLPSNEQLIKPYKKPQRYKPGTLTGKRNAPPAQQAVPPLPKEEPVVSQQKPSAPTRVEIENRYNKPSLPEIYYNDKGNRFAYYHNRGIPRYNDILQYEPLKVNVWSAHTAGENMLIVHPQFSFNWDSGYGAFVPSAAVHYGITNEAELTIIPSGALITSDVPDGEDSGCFGDLPVHLRYMVFNINDFILTAKIHVNLPTNSSITTFYENGYAAHFQYNLPYHALSLYANLGYTFTFERHGISPKDYIEFGAGAEYAFDNSQWQAMFEVSGKQDRGIFITPSFSYDLSPTSVIRFGASIDISDDASNSVFMNATFLIGGAGSKKYPY